MKKICISFLVIAIIVLSAVSLYINEQTPTQEYLRMHIRANSDEEIDQTVKYAVRDAVVSYLTPIVVDIHTKEQARATLNSKLKEIKKVADDLLYSQGFNYQSSVKLKVEEFPTRIYKDFTLEQGYYDALIIELGEANGKNWWCVVYPPLCFTGGGQDYKIQSKILKVISDFKQKLKEGK